MMAPRISVKLGRSVSDACIDSITPQVTSVTAYPASPAQPCGANSRLESHANPTQKIRFSAA